MKTVKFTKMKDGSKEEYLLLDKYEKENKLLIYTTCGRLVHIDADIVYEKEFN